MELGSFNCKQAQSVRDRLPKHRRQSSDDAHNLLAKCTSCGFRAKTDPSGTTSCPVCGGVLCSSIHSTKTAPSFREKAEQLFLSAVHDGSALTAERCLKAGVSVHATDKQRRGAIELALLHSRPKVDLLRFLWDKGARIPVETLSRFMFSKRHSAWQLKALVIVIDGTRREVLQDLATHNRSLVKDVHSIVADYIISMPAVSRVKCSRFRSGPKQLGVHEAFGNRFRHTTGQHGHVPIASALTDDFIIHRTELNRQRDRDSEDSSDSGDDDLVLDYDVGSP